MPDTWPLPGRWFPNDSVPPAGKPRRTGHSDGVGNNVRVRKLLIGAVATTVVVILGAVGADFGAAIYAEYRLARSVRTAADLSWDPSVAHPGLPVHHPGGATATTTRWRSGPVASITPSSARRRWRRRCTRSTWAMSWLVAPDATLPVGKVESRIIIDSTHVGRFMGIPDLLVEAPTAGDQRLDRRHHRVGHLQQPRRGLHRHAPEGGLRREGQHRGRPVRSSGRTQTTLVLTATGVLTGPGTADQDGARRQDARRAGRLLR